MTNPEASHETPSFSLVLGGPLFQFLLRTRLAGTSLEWLSRRILFFIGITWLPLLLLSFFGGGMGGAGVRIPFLYDVEVHARFLVALPALLAAELFVHRRLPPAVQQFVARGIVSPQDMTRFRRAVDTSVRLRSSVALEAGLLIFVWTAGIWIWRNQVALGQITWYAMPGAGSLELTPAGYCYSLVSIPIFQFILGRWYLRLFLWIWFLWRVSRLHLELEPMHTDGAGGLGFLGQGSVAFAPILFAQGALLAGFIADRIFFMGQNLADFRFEALTLLVLSLLIVLGPLAMFTPHLIRAKWRGELENGALVSHHAQSFNAKWVRLDVSRQGELLGSPDFSSLADLGSAYATMRNMRLLPFGIDVVIWLTVVMAVPLLPLILTAFSADELLTKVIEVLF